MRRFTKACSLGEGSVSGGQRPCVALKGQFVGKVYLQVVPRKASFQAVFHCEGRPYGGVSNAKARGRFGALNANNGRDVPQPDSCDPNRGRRRRWYLRNKTKDIGSDRDPKSVLAHKGDFYENPNDREPQ